MSVDHGRLQAACREILTAIGENVDRPGLVDTPRRFADSWAEFIDFDPGTVDTTFDAVEVDQLVVVSGIRVWSLCEHHMLPFSCDVAIGYISVDKILGLSKFGRIAHQAAHKLQVQERLAQEIADVVSATVGSKNVGVITRGEHLCMTMRGVRTAAAMTSSVVRGSFRDNPALRAEFLALADRDRRHE